MGLYARYVFPRLLNWVMNDPAKVQSRNEALRPAAGEILEIGFGTGLNLPCYPAEVRRVVAVDVSPDISKRAQARMEASPIDVEMHVLSAERLPFADQSFDTVVSTWTMCSIPDLDQALAEVHRVLRPGGKVLFVEHGLADCPGIRRWQRRLNPINRWIGCGCNLDRDIETQVAAHFEIVSLRKYYMASTPKIGGYTYQGEAYKP